MTNDGREYLEMTYVEATKKSQGDDYNEINEEPIIISQPNSRKCPVASNRLYLSKLTDSKDLFQLPNPYYNKPNASWLNASQVVSVRLDHS